MIPYKKIQKATVQQHDQSDCGVACLRTVLRYYGQDVSLEQLRDWSGTTATGTTMLGLLQAAEKTGMTVAGYEATIQNLREAEDTCILHVLLDHRLYHYLVFWGYDENLGKFIISDPGKGTVEEYTEYKLKEIWASKSLLLLEPSADWKENTTIPYKQSQWRWMWSFLQPDLNLLGMALVLGILVAILGLSTAIFSQQLIDNILPSGDKSRLFGGVALLAGLLIMRAILSYIRQFFLLRQARDFNVRIVRYFFESLMHLPKSFFDNRRTGDLVARMHDTTRIQRTVSQVTASALIDVLMVIVALGAAMYYYWSVGIIMVVWLPIFGYIAWRYHQPILKGQQEVMAGYAHAESVFVDAVQGAGTIKLFNKQSLFSQLVHTIYSFFQQKILDLSKVALRFNFWTELVGGVFTAGLLLYISWLVLAEVMTVGMVMAVLQLAMLMMGAAARLAMTNVQLQEARVAFERMREFTGLESELEEELEESHSVITNFEELKIQQLQFRFPGRKLLLQRVDMHVRKRELIVLQGETGSGKSTLLQLLQKFYTAESGGIKVNGIDLDLVSTESWRNCLGVVEQETKIFNGTIAENILLGETIENSTVFKNFLDKYDLTQFYEKFPTGLNTLVGKNGITLSGGQKQIIGLTRALWKKPQLLLLDEPTAALDIDKERFVHNLLHQLREEMAILLLTHRTTVNKFADRVYKIEQSVIRQQPMREMVA